MNKTGRIVLIVAGVTAAGFGFVYAYQKIPPITIKIDLKSGIGYVKMGNKSASFTKTEGVVMATTWNGVQVSAAGDGKYSVRKNGKTIESGTITPYDGGSSIVAIEHITAPAK